MCCVFGHQRSCKDLNYLFKLLYIVLTYYETTYGSEVNVNPGLHKVHRGKHSYHQNTLFLLLWNYGNYGNYGFSCHRHQKQNDSCTI